MSAHTWGTDIRRSIDVGALGQAIARPGTDLRYWVSHGTVCTVDETTGDIDTQNPNAIWIGPEGVECDVRLEPLMIHVCCRYAGITAGDVTMYPPINPGDLVLVCLPEGFAHLPVIVNILNSRSAKQALGPDRKPIFDNKRLLIHAKTCAIDIRNAGGVQVLIEQDGTVTTTAEKIKQGSANAADHAVLGDTYTTQWQTLLTALQTYIAAIDKPVIDPDGAALSAFSGVLTQLQGETFVSPKVTLE